jgi:hypothetical protein
MGRRNDSYHRKDGLVVKVGDDLLSVTRIGVMDIRNAKPGVLGTSCVPIRGTRLI